MNLEFNKKTHQYFKNKKELIPVSRILDNYFGQSFFCSKCNLNPSICKCKNNCNLCDAVRNAILRGSSVHKVLELYFKNINRIDVVHEIKELIATKFNKTIITYCHTALTYIDRKLGWGKKEFIIEKPFAYDIVAGTPDLLYSENKEFHLVDYKTYKDMTKKLKLKAELQLTAYYWLATNNGINVSNNAYIYWIQRDKLEIIPVEITKEKIHEWEISLALWKDEKHV